MTLPSIGCMYAFLYYKVFKPNLARPFAIPGKVFGAVLMVIPVLAVTLGNMYIAISKPLVVSAYRCLSLLSQLHNGRCIAYPPVLV